jgi:hypothetical protein
MCLTFPRLVRHPFAIIDLSWRAEAINQSETGRILGEWVMQLQPRAPSFEPRTRDSEAAGEFLPLQGRDRHSFAPDCKVVARAVLGGLHHEYRWERLAA